MPPPYAIAIYHRQTSLLNTPPPNATAICRRRLPSPNPPAVYHGHMYTFGLYGNARAAPYDNAVRGADMLKPKLTSTQNVTVKCHPHVSPPHATVVRHRYMIPPYAWSTSQGHTCHHHSRCRGNAHISTSRAQSRESSGPTAMDPKHRDR